MTFRTRVFLTALAASAITLAVAVALAAYYLRTAVPDRVERALVTQARLAAATLAHRTPATLPELDAEADALGRLAAARVTFIASDGSVIGDSELSLDGLRQAENHASRPEVVEAHRDGVGVARRYSTTIGVDMLYVAVPVRNPSMEQLASVRMAVPLTDVQVQLAAVRRVAVVAGAAGLAAALVLAWAASAFLTKRVRAIAEVARRYSAGDLSRPARDYGSDEIGAVARALDGSVREIGRRAAELSADRARMEAILGGMMEGVLVVDDHGRLQLVNAAARRMLRLEGPAEGRHYLETVRHPDIAAQVGTALRGTPGEALELALSSNSTIMARSAPVGGGGASGAVVVLHDISDLRRTDRIRRDFVANVSHELRTPLTAIRGYVEALVDGGVEPDEARRFLEIVARHTSRMERLVRDLLRLARLEAGQEPVEHVPCSVEALFDGVEAELADRIEARRQTVSRDIHPDAATVTGDPAKLHDAFKNLLENAVNYSPEGGEIRMDARRRGAHVVLTVMDEGPGIPEADLPRVFERFYRVEKARSRGRHEPGGTGLGLAIVKHLIGLHGGRVGAANQPGKGAVFSVELPA